MWKEITCQRKEVRIVAIYDVEPRKTVWSKTQGVEKESGEMRI
jgi:hypothetical protein